MNLDNQNKYWNAVAELKTFTHPLDKNILKKYLDHKNKILDFGCGYGRIVKELKDLGYENIVGFDSSKELINRGKREENLPIFYIENPLDLPLGDNTIDAILVFAVLTCIPSNAAQMALIKMLHSKLKPGGIIYISDYYLQENSLEVETYQYLNNDPENYGVFSLPEGATFRHHTKEWISSLTKDFEILFENPIQVMTMNGHNAKGFQLVGQKKMKHLYRN